MSLEVPVRDGIVSSFQTTRSTHRTLKNSHQNTSPIPSTLVLAAILVPISTLVYILWPYVPLSLLVPATLSGTLVGSDLMDGARGLRDPFSPRVLVSAAIFLGFYVAPIIHVVTSTIPGLLPGYFSQWTKAFTDLAMLQLFSAVGYFVAVRYRGDRVQSAEHSSTTLIEVNRTAATIRWLVFFGVISIGVFGYVVIRLGGVARWLEAQSSVGGGLGFSGWLIYTSGAFPLLFFSAYLLHLRSKGPLLGHSLHKAWLAFMIFALLTFISSGLRGSRANLVWPLVVGIVLLHLLGPGIRRRTIVLFALILLAYGTIYNVYKKEGVEGLGGYLEGDNSIVENSAYNLGPIHSLLGDYSRTGIQGAILQEWQYSPFQLSFGRTYVGDMLLFIPGANGSVLFPTKSDVATRVLYARDYERSQEFRASRIYGLQGEAFYNFGVPGFILIMVPYGLIVANVNRRYQRILQNPDPRSSLAIAIVIPLVLVGFISDFDNVLRVATTVSLYPAVALWLGRNRDRSASQSLP